MPQPLIFFSYSRHDGVEFTLKLAHDLYDRGINTWIDQENIPDGSEWVVEIEDALTNAAFVLYVVTENANKSSNVRNEIIYALEEKKKLIPLKINDCKIPLFIRTYQYIDFSKDYEAGLSKLLMDLNLNTEPGQRNISKRKKLTTTNKTASEKRNKDFTVTQNDPTGKIKSEQPKTRDEKENTPTANLAGTKKRYNSKTAVNYNGYTDPVWWILLLLITGFSIACTYYGSKLFNYLFAEFNNASFQYQLSWTLMIIIGSGWGLAYAIKAEKNAPKRKYLFLGFGIPFFNIFLPEGFNDIIKGLFSALFINTLYTMLLSMVLAFLLNSTLNFSYSITFLIAFIGINIFSLFKFIIEDFT